MKLKRAAQQILNQVLLKNNTLDEKQRFLLNQVLKQVIPFNRPHQIKINHLDNAKSRCWMNNNRTNKNHLGGIHACSHALIGEYTAGMCLLKNIGIIDYRIILKKLEVEYLKQVKTPVNSECLLDQNQTDILKQISSSPDGKNIELTTNVLNSSNETVSIIKTHWHLKKWEFCKYV